MVIGKKTLLLLDHLVDTHQIDTSLVQYRQGLKRAHQIARYSVPRST